MSRESDHTRKENNINVELWECEACKEIPNVNYIFNAPILRADEENAKSCPYCESLLISKIGEVQQ